MQRATLSKRTSRRAISKRGEVFTRIAPHLPAKMNLPSR
jgi:hypothetical protein